MSEERIIQFLLNNGINVVECNLLMTYEQAQSLTFRIVVRAGDLHKIKDPSLWPDNVSLEPYKEKKRSTTRYHSGNNRIDNQLNKINDGEKPTIRRILKRNQNSTSNNNRNILNLEDESGRNLENYLVQFSNDRQGWATQNDLSNY